MSGDLDLRLAGKKERKKGNFWADGRRGGRHRNQQNNKQSLAGNLRKEGGEGEKPLTDHERRKGRRPGPLKKSALVCRPGEKKERPCSFTGGACLEAGEKGKGTSIVFRPLRRERKGKVSE